MRFECGTVNDILDFSNLFAEIISIKMIYFLLKFMFKMILSKFLLKEKLPTDNSEL